MHRLFAAAVTAALLASVPAAAQRVLTIGAQTPPSALDPHYHNTQNNNQIARMVFEPLFELDTKAQFQPRLARSMRPLDDLTWEVKLNTAARFHDGTPFEAEDVAFTFARVPTVPNSPALFTSAVRSIVGGRGGGPGDDPAADAGAEPVDALGHGLAGHPVAQHPRAEPADRAISTAGS